MRKFKEKSEMFKFMLDNNKASLGHEGQVHSVKDMRTGKNEIYLCIEEDLGL